MGRVPHEDIENASNESSDGLDHHSDDIGPNVARVTPATSGLAGSTLTNFAVIFESSRMSQTRHRLCLAVPDHFHR